MPTLLWPASSLRAELSRKVRKRKKGLPTFRFLIHLELVSVFGERKHGCNFFPLECSVLPVPFTEKSISGGAGEGGNCALSLLSYVKYPRM